MNSLINHKLFLCMPINNLGTKQGTSSMFEAYMGALEVSEQGNKLVAMFSMPKKKIIGKLKKKGHCSSQS